MFQRGETLNIVLLYKQMSKLKALAILLFTPFWAFANTPSGLPFEKLKSDPVDQAPIKKGLKTGFPKWDNEEPSDVAAPGQWTFGGNSVISTSQARFSNWQGGGENSIAISTSLSLNLAYRSRKLNWESSLDAGYGIMLQGRNGKWFKNDDRLEITTKFGLRANEKWFYTGLVSLGSQFQPGFYNLGDENPISEFMAPGYVLGSIGFDYNPSSKWGVFFDYNPSSKLSVFLGPATVKYTIVLNQDLANMGAYGVEAGEFDYVRGSYITLGKKLRSEVGATVRVEYNEPRIVKNVGLLSRVVLFTNYIENPGNIDVNFENTFNLQVNEFITTNLILHFIYDDDIQIALDEIGERTGPRLQFKQVLAVGLNINIGG